MTTNTLICQPNLVRDGLQTITLTSTVTIADQEGHIALTYVPDRSILPAASWHAWVLETSQQKAWPNWEDLIAHISHHVYDELLPSTMTLSSEYQQGDVMFKNTVSRTQPGYTPA